MYFLYRDLLLANQVKELEAYLLKLLQLLLFVALHQTIGLENVLICATCLLILKVSKLSSIFLIH